MTEEENGLTLEEEGEQAIKEYLADESSEPTEAAEPINLPESPEPAAPVDLPEPYAQAEDDESMGAPGPEIPAIDELDIPPGALDEPVELEDPNRNITIPPTETEQGIPRDAIIDKTEITEASEDEHDEDEPILIGDECDDYLLDPFSTVAPTSIIGSVDVGDSPKSARANHQHAGLPALPGAGTWVLTIDGATGVMTWVLTGPFACP